MTKPIENEITALLLAWRLGDDMALEKLTPQVYRELHRAARRCMRGERDGHSLQTTGLINELYLRLAGLNKLTGAAVLISLRCVRGRCGAYSPIRLEPVSLTSPVAERKQSR